MVYNELELSVEGTMFQALDVHAVDMSGDGSNESFNEASNRVEGIFMISFDVQLEESRR